MTPRCGLIVIAMVWVCTAAHSDEPPKLKPPLAFREVLLDASEIDAWILQSGEKYERVLIADFDRVANLAAHRPLHPDIAVGTRIEKAIFDEVRLVEGEVLSGRAALTIEHNHDKPALLPLAPCGIAITEHAEVWQFYGKWLGRDPPRATLGASDDGRFCVLVDKSGELEFYWSLRGRRLKNGDVEFSLALPSCPIRTLKLQLPAKWKPVMNHGRVVNLGQVEQVLPTDERLTGWEINLPGSRRRALTLRLEDSTVPRPQPDVRIKYSSPLTYRLWPRGVDVVAQLSLDVRDAPLQQLTLILDPPDLELVKAQVFEAVAGRTNERTKPVFWSRPAGAAPGTVVLHFPSAIRGPGHVLTLEATTPIKFDQRMTLPRLIPVETPKPINKAHLGEKSSPAKILWQEGTAHVWLEKSLSLEYLSTHKCRQSSGLSSKPFARFSGERLDVQFFAADVKIDVIVTQQRQRVELASAATLFLSRTEIRGQTIVEFRGMEGERFELNADVGSQWTIDAVNAMSGEALGDWEVEVGKMAGRKLHVRLAKPLKQGETLRFAIAGRRLNAPSSPAAPRNRPLSFADLEMVRFSGVQVRRRLLAIDAASPLELRLIRLENARPLDPSKLEASDLRLFQKPPTGILLRLNGFAPQCEIAVTEEKDSLRADIRAEVLATAEALHETYVISCIPGGQPVLELEVHFSHARSSPLQWSLGAKSNGHLSATCETAADGEVWTVRLGSPQSGPFEIRATRSTPFSAKLPLSLPFIPQADEQHGWLGVRAHPRLAFDLVNQALTPASIHEDTQRQPLLRAAFRFDPLQHASGAAAITIAPSEDTSTLSGAVVWRARVDSFYDGSGLARHIAVFEIENSGLDAITLDLPENAGQTEVRVDGERVDLHGGQRRRRTIPLPMRPSRLKLRVEFSTAEPPLGLKTEVQSPMVGIDVPVLQRQWTVWLPASYEAVSATASWLRNQAPAVDWQRRLLGPLARPIGQPPFDPTSSADWTAWFDRSELSFTSPAAASMASPSRHPSDLAGPNMEGWKGYRFVGPAGTSAAVYIVHRATIDTIGWASLPLIACLVWCIGRWSFKCLFVTAALFAGAALFVPDVYVPFTSRAMLGMFSGWLMVLVLRRRRVKPSQPGSGISSTVANTGKVAMALAALMTLGVSSQADDAPVNEKPLPAVIVSQDKNAKHYHVPNKLWEAMQRRFADLMREPRSWLIEQAKYATTIIPPAALGNAYEVEIDASFILQTFRDDQTVQIDFGAPVDKFITAGANPILDGIPLKLNDDSWIKGGRVLSFDIKEAGSHTLDKLQFRPTVRADAGGWRIDQPIPLLANAKLEVSLPANRQINAQASSAIGIITLSENGRVLRGDLGPAQRITLVWKDKDVAVVSPMVEVDQLFWMRVKPGSVSMQVKLFCNVLRGNLRELQIVTDRGLQLRGDFLFGDGSKIASRRSGPDGQPHEMTESQIYTLTFNAARSEPFVIRAEFLLDDAPGIGVLRFPRFDVLATLIGRRLAVTLDPNLECVEILDKVKIPVKNLDKVKIPNKPPQTTTDFLARWGDVGDAEEIPRLVRDLTANPQKWTLKTHPHPPKKSVEQVIRVSVGSGRADVRYQAEVSIAGGSCFQHRLIVPPSLVVDGAGVMQDGKQRNVQWSANALGIVTLFLAERAEKIQQIELRGHLATPMNSKWTAPWIEVEGSETASSVTRLFRQSSVRVTPLATAAQIQRPLAKDASTRDESLGQPLGQFPDIANGRKLFFRLQPNQPRINAALLLTTVRKEDDLWKTDVFFDLTISGGVLDSVSFDAPAEIIGPFDTEPVGRVERLVISGEKRSRWRYVPDSPLRGKLRIRISAPLPALPGQPIETPDIRLFNPARVVRFLALPKTAGSNSPRWETEGLSRIGNLLLVKNVSLRSRLANILESIAGKPDLFRIRADARFHATLRPTPDLMGLPRVRIADIALSCFGDGTCHGLARFDLEPRGITHCEFEIVSGFRLLRATVEGLPAMVTRIDGHWRLALASATLPQQIELVFAGKIPDSISESSEFQLNSVREFVTPKLIGVPVDTMLWSVTRPSECLVQTQGKNETTSWLQNELARLQSGAETMQDAAGRLTAETLRSWYRPRLTRWLRSLREFERRASTSGSTDAEDYLQEAASLENAQVKIARKLGFAEYFQPRSDGSFPSLQRQKPLRLESAVESMSVAYFSCTGPVHTITVDFRPIKGDSLYRRVGAFLVILLSTAIFLLLPRAWEWTSRWPHWLGVALGLVWWLWLWPSVLGWLIIAFSLISFARSPWRVR